MTLIKEVEVNTLLERMIEEKRKYKPRNHRILPITKGKKKGPKYTFDECSVLVYMALYPEVTITKDKNITAISQVFNRSEASISMTLANARSILFNTGKLINVGGNLKKACRKYESISKNEFTHIVGDILKRYNYNVR